MKELQNEEIVSKDGYAKSGFIMFSDNYNEDDTMICCRLWMQQMGWRLLIVIICKWADRH